MISRVSLDAIHDACLSRFRPILMTTTCALLGGIPLMLGTGTGSELREPLGYTIVGGLLVSQVLTLFTTPVIYLYMDRLTHLFDRQPSAPALAITGGARRSEEGSIFFEKRSKKLLFEWVGVHRR